MLYKIHVNDRSYNSWEVFDTNKFNKVEVNINPIEGKLFANDVFTIDKHNKINIVHSSIRSGPAIPGVLILDGNKTYGRERKLVEGSIANKSKIIILGDCCINVFQMTLDYHVF